METKTYTTLRSGAWTFAFLMIGIAGNIFSSAKWGIGFFGWVSPLGFLYFARFSRSWLKWVFLALGFLAAALVSALDVAPFPVPVLLVVGLIRSLKVLIIYALYVMLQGHSRRFFITLYFPAAFTTLDFLDARMGGGVWWSVANAQYGFAWLRQWASVTGIWGISFLLYWFASAIIWSVAAYAEGRRFSKGLLIYGTSLALVLAYGARRCAIEEPVHSQRVRVSGLTVPSFAFMTGLYKDFCGKDVSINPRSSITSPGLKEINRAQVPFIESADTVRFQRGYTAMRTINDSLFSLSSRAAAQGARIILWSEANALVFDFDEASLTRRGSEFAAAHKVYLLMARAVILPGKLTRDRKIFRNEAILFGPDGRILNIFHKNNPVPVAESSIPGDGVVPVTETPFGRIATSICYDADFPLQMEQLGRKRADLLLLPSGDWSAIAPYHSYMAVFRGIENGTAIVRQASGGLSVASDYRGRILGSFDFYREGEKIWFVDLPLGHITTLYNRIGDAWAYLCIAATGIGIIFLVWAGLRRRLLGFPRRELAGQS